MATTLEIPWRDSAVDSALRMERLHDERTRHFYRSLGTPHRGRAVGLSGRSLRRRPGSASTDRGASSVARGGRHLSQKAGSRTTGRPTRASAGRPSRARGTGAVIRRADGRFPFRRQPPGDRHRPVQAACSRSAKAAWAPSSWPSRPQPVQRKVALKVIKPGMDSRQVIARFEAERQALAMMDHANIARVLDAGTTDSRPALLRHGAGPRRARSPSTATTTT